MPRRAGTVTNMATPLLELKNIGKIYVSDSNVSVGIRGVDLTFERGEFVAVTGKSGSGKSTLLNVISGMDTYEEGELLIEGEPTSHYQQKDWEQYRQEYISFIFQDYNIIESFTVLQNVELALMNIEDPRERREKALSLLRRVGMEKHLNHRGSKLSGGQKQRTVIARALAKDSPIILADEPTGNLDSKSSEEIIELLREISHDKLVIIVTHNFEQVEAHATRHIRIFDGAVDADQRISEPEPLPALERKPIVPPTSKTAQTLRNGLLLGRVRFAATPKLSVFLCILMMVAALILTMMTSITYDATELFDQNQMFTHIDGRTVIVRRDGAIITDKELEELSATVGAKDHIHYDFMLDRSIYTFLGNDWDGVGYQFSFGYLAANTKLDAGRLPTADNEVVMDVPISAKTYLGGDQFKETELPLLFNMASYKVVGVRYYYDNTVTPRLLFTENGYKIASAIAFYSEQKHNFAYTYEVRVDEESVANTFNCDTYLDWSLAPNTYYVSTSAYKELEEKFGKDFVAEHSTLTMSGSFQNYDYDVYYDEYGNGNVIVDSVGPAYGETSQVKYDFKDHTRVNAMSEDLRDELADLYHTGAEDIESDLDCMILSPSILLDFMYDHYYTQAYTQASLFFKNDHEADQKVETLRELGYIAVVSDETAEADVFTMLVQKLGLIFDALGWVLTVVFATMFLSLCSSRAMNATKGDIAIMRSMGIPAGVVRVSIYVQTLIALIPAVLVTAGACVAVYLIPKTNYIFPFLHLREYIIIGIVLVLIALNLSRKHVQRMFGESVKKTLKGGNKA